MDGRDGTGWQGGLTGHTEQLCVRAPGMLHGGSFRICPALRHRCRICVTMGEGAGYPRTYGSAQAHVRPSASGPVSWVQQCIKIRQLFSTGCLPVWWASQAWEDHLWGKIGFAMLVR